MDVTQNLLMQNILLFGSLFGIIACLFLLKKYKHKKGYVIAPLTYFIDAFLFYLTVELREYNIYLITGQQLLIWSTIVRLHSLVIILVYMLVGPNRRE